MRSFGVATWLLLVSLVSPGYTQELDGAWIITKFENGGKADAEKVGVKVTIEGDKVTLKEEGKNEGTIKMRFDATKKPKQCDVVGGNDELVPGIYVLESDVLKMCFDVNPLNDRRQRPPDILDQVENVIVVTLKRDKK
jgi:uncharacterized protein (TIGR03067 family)